MSLSQNFYSNPGWWIFGAFGVVGICLTVAWIARYRKTGAGFAPIMGGGTGAQNAEFKGSRQGAVRFGILEVMPILGVIAFLGGFVLLVRHPADTLAGLLFVFAGLLLPPVYYLVKNHLELRGWQVGEARCVDRQFKRVLSVSDGTGGGWIWVCDIVCEYEHLGRKYRVRPAIHWPGFFTEKGASKFLEKRIASDGRCLLRFSPKNPMQTQLLGEGPIDRLSVKLGL